MRTTLDLGEDVLLRAKQIARRERKTAGEVITELARLGLDRSSPSHIGDDEALAVLGFRPLPAAAPVTNADVDRLRDEAGI